MHYLLISAFRDCVLITFSLSATALLSAGDILSIGYVFDVFIIPFAFLGTAIAIHAKGFVDLEGQVLATKPLDS